MEKLINRIRSHPDVCNGKPVIRGIRISVSTILEYLAAGETPENILAACPVLEPKGIRACLENTKSIADKSIFRHDLQAT